MNKQISFHVQRRLFASAASLLLLCSPSVQAQTFAIGGAASWAIPANWNPATIPNGIGAFARFDSPVAAIRTVSVDSGPTGFTVGSITIDNNSTFANVITQGTTGSMLIMDEAGSGPASILVSGGGVVNNNISAPMTLIDSVIVTVANTKGNATSGALTLSGIISGSGGLTKQASGTLTISTANKTYTGPTLFDTNTGRTRFSPSGSITASSSVTVKSGAQLDLIASSGNTIYSMGLILNLNGTGIATFPGAIRLETGLIGSTATPVVLQTDSAINMSGTAAVMTFTSTVSGPGGLIVNYGASDPNNGNLVLNGAGSFLGSTIVSSGTLVAGAISGQALGGTSSVTLNNAGAPAVLMLGASNQINDAAPVTLKGGQINTAGFSEGSTGVGGVGIPGAGPLTLSLGSTIDMGNLSSILAFSNSRASSWTGNLSIYNWSGTPGIGGGVDQLFFGSDAAGLNSAQLGKITFYSDLGITQVGSGSALILGTGEVVPVPEPSMMLVSVALLGLVRFRRQKGKLDCMTSVFPSCSSL